MNAIFYYATSLLVAGTMLARAQGRPAPAGGPDSVALAAARQPYQQAVQAESRLLNGTEYVSTVRPGSQGFPFFDSAIAQPATIRYDGQVFTAVPLLYDIQRDQVVLPLPDRDLRLQLLAEKVESFTLGSHHFVRRTPADTLRSTGGLRAGFYDLLLPGGGAKVALLARYTKRERQEPSGGRLAFVLDEKKQLYLQQGTSYAEVSSLRDLQRLLPAHQAELQQYARAQRLKFRNNSQEAAAVALLTYYNTLLPN